MKATLYSDGGCAPTNPGPSGFACIVTFSDDSPPSKVARFYGWRTNNEAEYAGLIVGIKLAADRRAEYLHVVTDSQLVLNQIYGNWAVKNPRMKHYCAEARQLLEKHFGDNWHIEWVKGHADDPINNEVDALCTAVIKAHREKRRDANPFVKKAGLLPSL